MAGLSISWRAAAYSIVSGAATPTASRHNRQASSRITSKGPDAELEQRSADAPVVGTLQDLVCGERPMVKRDQGTGPDIRREDPDRTATTEPPQRRQKI